MVPSVKLNAIIGGVLAKYQEMFRIIVYAYCVLGNHIHLVLRAEEQNLDEFMENVLREIARRVNRHQHRRGHLWARRYDDQVILREEDLLEAFLYVITNAVKHGLVSDIRTWPGLECYHQLISEKERTLPFVHYSEEDEEGRPIITFHKLTLTPLPQHADLPQDERKETLIKLIQERQAELVKARKEKGLGFLGAKKICSQRPGRIPVAVSYAPRPICYTKNAEIRRYYRAERRAFKQAYYEASRSFRSGNYTTQFPPHCFKPPLHRKPKQLRAVASA